MILHPSLGYLAVALLVSGESLGLLVPGETALLAAGVLARAGDLHIALVVPLGALAAIAGDNAGYLLGRRGGQMLLLARGPFRAWRARMLERGERFFAVRGGRAVFLGRWMAFARVTVPWLAGASAMPWRAFFAWNVLGGMTWVTTVAFAGYAFGAGAGVVLASTNALLLALLAALAVTAAWRERRR